MLLEFALLLAGFLMLIKGADWLIAGASSLARRSGISELIIGLTIVAFGTSAPELVVSLVASVEKYNQIVLGNVIGSNNFNTFIILGIAALIRPVTVQTKTVRTEIPFSLITCLILLLLLNDQLIFQRAELLSRTDGIILILFFLFFMFYVYQNIQKDQLNNPITVPDIPFFKTILLIGIGLAGLIAGGKFVVDNAVIIARNLGLSERLIGLTIISIGTSLPELVTSVLAAARGKSDLAIGNVIGSNIFNLLLILGISGIIQPISYSNAFNPDFFLFTGACLLLLTSMLTGKKKVLDRWEGGLFVIIYLLYLYYTIFFK